MSVLRSRAPEQVRRDALTVADRKAAEGCMPCAETYLSVAEQHGASPAEVDRTRRRLFARAGALAGLGLAASLVDVGALVQAAAAATPRNPLGGWLADPQQVAPALLNSPAYVDGRNHLLREGVDVEQDGAFMLLPAKPARPGGVHAGAAVRWRRVAGTPDPDWTVGRGGHTRRALAVCHRLRGHPSAGAQDGALRWPGGPRPVARRAVRTG